MKFGLFGINMNVCSDPDVAARIAKAAEGAGFESVWTGRACSTPRPASTPSPLPPEYPLLDPAVALAFVAAHMTKIRLGTGHYYSPTTQPTRSGKGTCQCRCRVKGPADFRSRHRLSQSRI